jgi:hypothetical protein
MKEGPLVQMLDRRRVQQAAADEAKKLVCFRIGVSGANPSSLLKISNRMKKISYGPRRNLLQPQFVKNLL